MKIAKQILCATTSVKPFVSLAISRDHRFLVGYQDDTPEGDNREKDRKIICWDTSDGQVINVGTFANSALVGLACDTRHDEAIACIDRTIYVRGFHVNAKWIRAATLEQTIQAVSYSDGMLHHFLADNHFQSMRIELADPIINVSILSEGFRKHLTKMMNDSTTPLRVQCLAVTDGTDFLAVGTNDGIFVSYRGQKEKAGTCCIRVKRNNPDNHVTSVAWLPNHRLLYTTKSGLYYMDVLDNASHKELLRPSFYHIISHTTIVGGDTFPDISHITIVNGNTFAIIGPSPQNIVNFCDIDTQGNIHWIDQLAFKSPITSLLSYGDGQFLATNTNCDYSSTSTNPGIIDFGYPNLGRDVPSEIFNKLPV